MSFWLWDLPRGQSSLAQKSARPYCLRSRYGPLNRSYGWSNDLLCPFLMCCLSFHDSLALFISSESPRVLRCHYSQDKNHRHQLLALHVSHSSVLCKKLLCLLYYVSTHQALIEAHIVVLYCLYTVDTWHVTNVLCWIWILFLLFHIWGSNKHWKITFFFPFSISLSVSLFSTTSPPSVLLQLRPIRSWVKT